ncbi:MAG: peptidoglycan editing factor PgeF [Deltaproteobacteria bacterium]|nr:peptidoglycan editing factor PgeF [Deltaproteobacteria bacterium]
MLLNDKNGILFFQFPNLAGFSEIQHGIFTRKCGYSKEPYNGLNVSFEVEDNPELVKQNRDILCNCIKGKEFVYAKQKHDTQIIILTKNNKVRSNASFVGDAMITDILGKYLVIQVADCQSLLLYDPARHVVANVHSGWRGSIKNITGKTIKEMEKKFGCRSENIIAGIGPSLGPCCAEFVNYKKEIPFSLWKYRDNDNLFDFWALSLDQLLDAGLLIKNIHSSNICTKCNTDLFFSFRGEGTTGRFATVIGLR